VAAKILVVEGDNSPRHVLRGELEAEGFRVVTASDAEAGLRAVSLERPDAIVVERAWPTVDGLSVYRHIRADSDTRSIPILVLIGGGDEIDDILTLGLGGDDFMTEPYNEQELLARLKTLLRRTAMSPPTRMLRAGAIEMDLDCYVVKVSGEQVQFTSKEFDLLRILMEARGRVLRREFLLERVWGYGRSDDLETRTIDVHIRRVRRKLGSSGSSILTVRNVGYRFDMSMTLLAMAGDSAVHS
jgi:two-component system, OmpR family, alkaline phosphatase synthesis response regulator PhoP